MASAVQEIEAVEPVQAPSQDERRPHQKYNPSSDEVRKMYAGEQYNSMTDPTLVRDRALVRSLVYKYNVGVTDDGCSFIRSLTNSITLLPSGSRVSQPKMRLDQTLAGNC